MDFRTLPPEGRRILVLANCQTGGLTSCLSLFLPKDVVSGLSWDAGKGQAEVADAAAESDVVVTNAPPEILARLADEHGFDEAKCLVVPSLFFPGFHPDLTNAFSGGKLVSGIFGAPYQSAIGVWCWKQGLDLEQTRRLFTAETMAALGFDRSWSAAVAQMRAHFQGSPVAFADFFLPLQASGRPFMHTFNHPNISAIAQLARGVARLLGAEEANLRQAVETVVPDALGMGAIWPIYPGVAESLALPPSLSWKFGNAFYDLDGYLNEQFRALDAVGAHVDCHMTDAPDFDAVMRVAATR